MRQWQMRRSPQLRFEHIEHEGGVSRVFFGHSINEWVAG